MSRPSLADKLASLRAASGLTQEEVATHLGITKAAVSKWECGQSMPDVAMLPLIAELYGVSIDDLFGRSADVPQSEVDAAYLKALDLLGADRAAGMEFVDAQAKRHWSCLPFVRMLGTAAFAQIPACDGFGSRPLKGDAAMLASMAEKLFRRAIKLDRDGGSFQADIAPLARILQWSSRFDEAKALVEDFVAPEPNLAALSLAQLYLEEGRRDAAVEVLQRQLLASLVESMGVLAAFAPLCSDDQLKEAAELAEGMQRSAEYVSLFPMLLPTIWHEAAKRDAKAGSHDEALASLAAFASALDSCCGALLHPENPALLDRVHDLAWEEESDDTAKERAKAAENVRRAYALGLSTDSCWEGLRGSHGFQSIASRVSGAPDAKEARHEQR